MDFIDFSILEFLVFLVSILVTCLNPETIWRKANSFLRFSMNCMFKGLLDFFSTLNSFFFEIKCVYLRHEQYGEVVKLQFLDEILVSTTNKEAIRVIKKDFCHSERILFKKLFYIYKKRKLLSLKITQKMLPSTSCLCFLWVKGKIYLISKLTGLKINF